MADVTGDTASGITTVEIKAGARYVMLIEIKNPEMGLDVVRLAEAFDKWWYDNTDKPVLFVAIDDNLGRIQFKRLDG